MVGILYFWVFQTLELWILTFPDIGILNFGVSKHWNCEFWLSKTLEFWTFPFPNIAIENFGFSKHCNCDLWLFQTLQFFIFGFFKHWKSGFWLFETLTLAFPNIGILNSGFLPFLTIFYSTSGLALELDINSGQSSFYKNGVCTVLDVIKFAMCVLFIFWQDAFCSHLG